MKKLRSAKPRLSVLALAVQAACGFPVWALPQGATVVHGAATISQPAANTLQVQAGNGAIIHWQRFSIGGGETTRFVQPDASSAVLNRVTGGEVSQLLGQLQANGRVFLVNPSGIVVGAGARIDTNSFIASTLDIADADFLAGRLKFLAGGVAGGIRNDGIITAGPGGKIALIAPDIVNSGIIQAEGGNILLAAGRSIEITSSDLAGVRFEIRAPSDSVLNLGKLLADNGAVRAFASTLRNEGVIRAERLVQGADGRVELVAAGDLSQSASGSISASGVSGGSVTLQSLDGTARVAGTVSASSGVGQGGQVHVLGQRVAVESGARLDVSGATGGGELLVGGDFQGANPEVQNAQRVYVAEGAQLAADATVAGHGGRVIVWADENTRFHGAISARGGSEGGHGGFAEVSGKQNLEFRGTADLSATAGALGTLLLDPLDIVVANGSGILPSVTDEFGDFAANVVTIDPTRLDELKANVTLQASRDVFVKDRIALTTSGASLTIDAGGAEHLGGFIHLEDLVSRPGGISTTGGAVTLRADSILGPAGISTVGGAVTLQATGNLQYSGAIRSGGGQVTLNSSGGSVSSADVEAGSGAIVVDGQTGVFGGRYLTSGSASFTSAAGGINLQDVTSGTASLQAQSGINATVNAAQRIDASSTNGTLTLFNATEQLLRLGTLDAGTVNVFASAGAVQVAGGGIRASTLNLSTQGGSVSLGTALDPLSLQERDLNGLAVRLDGRGNTFSSGLPTLAPAFLSLGSTTRLTGLDLYGNVAALQGVRISGGNVVAWTAGPATAGTLDFSRVAFGTESSAFSGVLKLNVSDGGLKLDEATLTGGALNIITQGSVALGDITTTRLGADGVRVYVNRCSFNSFCTLDSSITARTIDAGGGDVNLDTRDNGIISVSEALVGRNITVNAGDRYSDSTRYIGWPWFTNLQQRTTNTIDIASINASGSVGITHRGHGDVTIGSLTSGNRVDIYAGNTYFAETAPNSGLYEYKLTTNNIDVTSGNDPLVPASGYLQIGNGGIGDVTLTGDINRASWVYLYANNGSLTVNGNITATSDVDLRAGGGSVAVGDIAGGFYVDLDGRDGVVAGDVAGGYSVDVYSGQGAAQVGDVQARYWVEIDARDGVTTGNLTSIDSEVDIRSAQGAVDVQQVTAGFGVTIEAGGNILFDKVTMTSSVYGVEMVSTQGSIQTRTDDGAAIDINSAGAVILRAEGVDQSIDRMDIRGSSVTLSSGLGIGTLAAPMRIDSGVIDITSLQGSFDVEAVNLTGEVPAPRLVTSVALSAGAAGVGDGNVARFSSTNLSIAAESDGSTLSLGSIAPAVDAQFDRLAFRASEGNLEVGNITLASTLGQNELSLRAAGELTQEVEGTITARRVTLQSDTQSVAVGDILSTQGGVTVSAANGIMIGDGTGNVSAGTGRLSMTTALGDLLVGDLTAASMDLRATAGNLAIGSATTTGTLRWTPSYGTRISDLLSLNAGQGITTAGNLSSLTRVVVNAGTSVQVGSTGTGSVTAGNFAGDFTQFRDGVAITAGTGLQAGAVSGNLLTLAGGGGAVVATSLSGADATLTSEVNLDVAGATLTGTGRFTAGSLLALQNTKSNWLTLTASEFSLGSVEATQDLFITARNDFVTGQETRLSAANANIRAAGVVNIAPIASDNELPSWGLTATTTTLTAGGRIDASMRQPSDTGGRLTLRPGTDSTVADAGFSIDAYGWIDTIDIHAAWDRATGPNGSSSVGTNLQLGEVNVSQYFSLYQDGVVGLYASSFSGLGRNWSVVYQDTSANVAADGLSVYMGHDGAGRLDLAMGSDTAVSLSAALGGGVPGFGSGLRINTGGAVNLQSVTTGGGSVDVTSRAGGIDFSSINTDAASATTAAGFVDLKARGGDIRYQDRGSQLIQSDVAAFSIAPQSGITALGGRVSLTASGNLGTPSASIEEPEVPLPVYGAAELNLNAPGFISAYTGSTVPQSISISTSVAGSAESVRIWQAGEVESTVAFEVVRNPWAQRLEFGALPVGVTGFGLTATDGGIAVNGDLALTSLNLNAGAGDLVIRAAGAAPRTVSAASMALQASRRILVQAGAAATESVSVATTSGNMTLTAGSDVRIEAGGASASVSSTGVSYLQRVQAGGDIVVSAGQADNVTASLQANLAGGGFNAQQQIVATGDVQVLAGSGANASASISSARTQQLTAAALTVQGGGDASTAAITAVSGQTWAIGLGGALVQGGSGAGATAAVTGGTQSGTITGSLRVIGGNAVEQGAGASATASTVNTATTFNGAQTLRVRGAIEVLGGTAAGTSASIESRGNQDLTDTYNDTTDSVLVRAGSGDEATAFIRANGTQRIFAGVLAAPATGNITVEGGSGLNAAAGIVNSGTGSQTVGVSWSHNDCSFSTCIYIPTNNITVWGGTGQGASATISSGGAQTVAGRGLFSVRGGSGAGSAASVQAATTQWIGRANDSRTQAAIGIEVLAGTGGTASISTLGTGNTSQWLRSAGDITVRGGVAGSAEGMFAAVRNEGGAQNISASSLFASGTAPATQTILVQGGETEGATATLSGLRGQTLIGSSVRVIGGSGSGADAAALAGRVAQDLVPAIVAAQTIGSMGDNPWSQNPTTLIEVAAGSGGTARVFATGGQTLRSVGDIVVRGGTAADMTASIEADGSQVIGNTRDYYAPSGTLRVVVQGGTAAGADASIRGGTGQYVYGDQAIEVVAAANGGSATIANLTGAQYIGMAPNYSWWGYAPTDGLAITAAQNASASVESGGSQTVSDIGTITLTAASGASARLVGGTGQNVSSSGAITLNGGADSGTGEVASGILALAGNQVVSAGGDLTLRGGSGATDVRIAALGTGDQSISVGGTLSLLAAAGSSVAIETLDGAQKLNVSRGIVLDNAGGRSAAISAAGGTQEITAASLQIAMSGAQAGASTLLSTAAGFDQSITLVGDQQTAGTATLSISNSSTGANAIAGIQSGGALSLTVTDDNYDTAGAVQVGSTTDTGRTEISAATDLTLVAGSLTIQGGATATANAAVNATGTMNISTLYGPVQLKAGSGGSATIDPVLLNAVSNGTVLLQGGGSPTAFSNITAGTFNLAATFGDLSVLAGLGAATITTDTFNFFGPNQVVLTGGTISVTAEGKIFIGGLCISCDTGLIGNWTVSAFVPPPIPPSLPSTIPDPVSGILTLVDDTGGVWELVSFEDGSGVFVRTRRNQCL